MELGLKFCSCSSVFSRIGWEMHTPPMLPQVSFTCAPRWNGAPKKSVLRPGLWAWSVTATLNRSFEECLYYWPWRVHRIPHSHVWLDWGTCQEQRQPSMGWPICQLNQDVFHGMTTGRPQPAVRQWGRKELSSERGREMGKSSHKGGQDWGEATEESPVARNLRAPKKSEIKMHDI